jgi:hypothetical protein
MKHSTSRPTLVTFAVSEWLLVLPAVLFLTAAALRLLQPPQYEPARTSWLIFEWATAHISRTGAALLFLGLPGIAVVAGCAALLLVWRRSEALRQDTVAVLASLRRHLAIAILGSGTLLAGAILATVLVHIITN